MKRSRPVLSLCAALVALVAASLPASAQDYCLTDLGSLAGNTTRAYDLNNSTQIVGISWVENPTIDFRYTPFSWQDGVMVDLGTLAPGWTASANRVNNYGWIIGTAGDEDGIARAAYTFAVPGAQWREILGLGIGSQGWGVNDNVWMVGEFFVATSNGAEPRAFAYHPRFGVFDLSTVEGTGRSAAYNLNNSQRIGGVSYELISDCTYAGRTPVIWTEVGFGQWEVAALPTNGICVASVMAVSEDGGTAVGFSETPVAPSPLVWTEEDSGAWTVEQLPTSNQWEIGGAMALNSSGQIVGFDADFAALWEDGIQTDLNQVTDLPPGWQLWTASGINDQGEICGTGTVGGEIRAFLLTPRPPGTDCP